MYDYYVVNIDIELKLYVKMYINVLYLMMQKFLQIVCNTYLKRKNILKYIKIY